MIPHLQNILQTLPIHLVMPAVLDQQIFLPHRKWVRDDIEEVLPTQKMEVSTRYQRTAFLDPQREPTVFNQLLHCANVFNRLGRLRRKERQRLPDVWKQMWNVNIPMEDKLEVIGLPVHSIDALPQNIITRGSFDQVLRDFAEILTVANDRYLVTLMEDLGSYITASSP